MRRADDDVVEAVAVDVVDQHRVRSGHVRLGSVDAVDQVVGVEGPLAFARSAGASYQPVGVTMSMRPSPLMSPSPLPWYSPSVPITCSTNHGSRSMCSSHVMPWPGTGAQWLQRMSSSPSPSMSPWITPSMFWAEWMRWAFHFTPGGALPGRGSRTRTPL